MKTFAAVLAISCMTVMDLQARPRSVPAAPITNAAPPWDGLAAANYLDNREAWWLTWSVSQRDHGTACVSCHTALPYALARPSLRRQLNESGPSAVEQAMLRSVIRRVTLWSEVDPFYTDKQAGPNKSVESRGTESVLDALILANYDAEAGHLSPVAKRAFEQAWALQLASGPAAGAWNWLNFHNAPWEGNESQYMGAAFAAVALGLAPENYRHDPAIADHRRALESYLRTNFGTQPLFNRALVLWASGKLPGLLDESQTFELGKQLFDEQRPDGGWAIARFGPWLRQDGTEQESRSDGYATGLVVLALEQSGCASTGMAATSLKRARLWLEGNQDRTAGLWASYSVNKKRDPGTDIGKFMTDAATAFAVLALSNGGAH